MLHVLLQERVKTTLATTASVEAQLPLQAQQILRQVSQGWMSPQGDKIPHSQKGRAVKRLWKKGMSTWNLQPSFPSLTSMLPSLCSGDWLLHKEGAEVLCTVPTLGWAHGKCTPLLWS